MHNSQIGLLIFLASQLQLSTPDSPGDAREPLVQPNASERYISLTREYEEAKRLYYEAIHAAKSADEAKRIAASKPRDQFAGRFLKLAQDYPDDPVAVDALIWIVEKCVGLTSTPVDDQAMTILQRDHPRDTRLRSICLVLGYSGAKASEPLLREILAKNTDRNVRAQACLGLGMYLKAQSDRIAASAPADASSKQREAERLLVRVTEEYGDVESLSGTVAERTLGETARIQLDELRNPELRIGALAYEIEGEDVGGRPMKLSEYRGRVVVLCFWGTWCGPCMALVPHERELVKRLEGKPFVLLGINSDREREALKDQIKAEGITWRSWWDGGGTTGPIATGWKVKAWPTIYVLDGKGVIRSKDVRGKELDAVIDRLLEEMRASKGS